MNGVEFDNCKRHALLHTYRSQIHMHNLTALHARIHARARLLLHTRVSTVTRTPLPASYYYQVCGWVAGGETGKSRERDERGHMMVALYILYDIFVCNVRARMIKRGATEYSPVVLVIRVVHRCTTSMCRFTTYIDYTELTSLSFKSRSQKRAVKGFTSGRT